MMLPLNNSMQVKITTKTSIGKIICEGLNSHTAEFSTEFTLDSDWYKLHIPTHRTNIVDITIAGQSIKHILNSGTQVGDHYHIWLHGDLDVLMERVFGCINQDDLLRWTKLNRKYLLTESWNHIAPDFVPTHIKNFFARGEGPYWWHYDNKEHIPYCSTDIIFDSQQLLGSLAEDLVYKDEKFYGSAHCRSLQAQPKLPLTEVSKIKNNHLRTFLSSVGYSSVLQIQCVEMEPMSYIDIHRDDFAGLSGLPFIKGASQLYCVLQGDPSKFNLRFARAGNIDVSRPIFINNNAFVHSLYYSGNEKRTTLLVYGVI